MITILGGVYFKREGSQSAALDNYLFSFYRDHEIENTELHTMIKDVSVDFFPSHHFVFKYKAWLLRPVHLGISSLRETNSTLLGRLDP